jgi:hypothetical protein
MKITKRGHDSSNALHYQGILIFWLPFLQILLLAPGGYYFVFNVIYKQSM